MGDFHVRQFLLKPCTTWHGTFRRNSMSNLSINLYLSDRGLEARSRKRLPFFMSAEGQVVVHDGETGDVLPQFWGLCTESCVGEFWKLYTSRGERAFAKLYAWDRREAELEARYLRLFRLLMRSGLGYLVVCALLRSSAEESIQLAQETIRSALRQRHSLLA